MKKQFETPILFLIFNRPENTYQVFEQIKILKPKYLFISADGPRNIKEEDLCNKTREIVNQIDWDCELKTLFRKENLGCGLAVSQGINWFFENVSQGIILEDDCLPHNDFFGFCEEMLKKYEDNPEVMQINGFNPLGSNINSNAYFKTIYPQIWGWATWKRGWNQYDYYLNSWDDFLTNKSKFLSRYQFMEGKIREYIWRKVKKELIKTGNTHTWDHQWGFAIMLNKGISILPESNLIINIGFMSGAHLNNSNNYYSKVRYGKLTSPIFYRQDKEEDFKKKSSTLYLKVKFRLV